MGGKKQFKLGRIIFVLFLVYFVYTFTVQQFKINELRRQELELSQKMNQLAEERKRLEKEIELLNTKSYIEKLARDQLGLVKPGEILYKISPSRDD
ncbi:FtsB family cell division protein [Thermosediminibacter oceani]|uniref:Septum formation initiator n=1 Tax=Thermosediminibacter oceani (strain ATCC BAA-1034 / DSM 16646 / JW/IW-1228P) TaxID=555079 RepID=D9RZK1_THEOJ|nr:septum formation initiator family protein [Thermosediminibacter oceani]ADL06899.1 Septum formation initiator [Thermosediminibacter oceani DSM 16646]